MKSETIKILNSIINTLPKIGIAHVKEDEPGYLLLAEIVPTLHPLIYNQGNDSYVLDLKITSQGFKYIQISSAEKLS